MLRYFRDLGYDSDLLLFSNDGHGNSDHFRPECDTWDIKKWSAHILQTSISDDPASMFGFPMAYFLSARSIIRSMLDRNQPAYFPVTRNKIKSTYSGYTHIVASGTSPAILQRSGITLSIFFPYSAGIEWLGDPVFVQKKKSKNPLTRIIVNKVIEKQSKAIQQATSVIYADKSLTEEAFKKINVAPISLMCPMVYNREILPDKLEDELINRLYQRILQSDFSALSHTRHKWVQPAGISVAEWKTQDKNNDWSILGFAELLRQGIVKKPLLILFEYGEDAHHSKKLCEELNISEYVIWMPKLDRKTIMWIISKVDVGIGEFYELPNMLFGGTGYEVLASGKPLIQGFNFSEEEFSDMYKISYPPLLAVTKPEDVIRHLITIAHSPEIKLKIGSDSRKWFDRYCGIELAKQWLAILTKHEKM